jgi:hypothetical protein
MTQGDVMIKVMRWLGGEESLQTIPADSRWRKAVLAATPAPTPPPSFEVARLITQVLAATAASTPPPSSSAPGSPSGPCCHYGLHPTAI